MRKALLDTYGYCVLQGGKHDMGLSKEVPSVCLQLPPPRAPRKNTTPKSHVHLTSSLHLSLVQLPLPQLQRSIMSSKDYKLSLKRQGNPLPWELPAHGAALPALSLQLQQHQVCSVDAGT